MFPVSHISLITFPPIQVKDSRYSHGGCGERRSAKSSLPEHYQFCRSGLKNAGVNFTKICFLKNRSSFSFFSLMHLAHKTCKAVKSLY